MCLKGLCQCLGLEPCVGCPHGYLHTFPIYCAILSRSFENELILSVVEEGDLIHGACSIKTSSGCNEVAAGPFSYWNRHESLPSWRGGQSSALQRGMDASPPGAEVSSLKHNFIEWHDIVQWPAGCSLVH